MLTMPSLLEVVLPAGLVWPQLLKELVTQLLPPKSGKVSTVKINEITNTSLVDLFPIL